MQHPCRPTHVAPHLLLVADAQASECPFGTIQQQTSQGKRSVHMSQVVLHRWMMVGKFELKPP